ncbi:DUF1289 domain-containing protein [Thalassotalea loyana]|uniref:DUF1289 domain-containing protein n=1 Tax=Thalassotalea loyana TaxID=280483 RepID=UPI0024E11333|nr:DUF1289 domain-containing protein [Thalassotalea loyana]
MLKSEAHSPCINNCCLNEHDICMGCYRSIEEICQWRSLTREEKSAVYQKIVVRKSELDKDFPLIKKI